MEIKEMIEKNGGIKNFSEKYGIPYRTVQNWKNEVNAPADWIKGLFDRINTLENHVSFLDELNTHYKVEYEREKLQKETIIKKVNDIMKAGEEDREK